MSLLLSIPFSYPSIDIVLIDVEEPKTLKPPCQLLEKVVKHTGESAIVSSRICPRLFLLLRLKFIFDREDFLDEIFILLGVVIFRPCGRGAKVGNKRNNQLSESILWSVYHPGPLV